MNLSDGNYTIVTTLDHLISTENDIVTTSDFFYSAGGMFGLQMDLRGNGMAQMVVRDTLEDNVVFYVSNNGKTGMTKTVTIDVIHGGRLKLIYHHSSGIIEGLISITSGRQWVSVGDSADLRIDISQGVAFQLAGVANKSATFSPTFDTFSAEGDVYFPPQLGQAGVVLERVTYLSGWDQRDFRMAVPASYDPGRPIGILFGFHGNMGSYISSQPYLTYLLGTGLEAETEQGYFLAVSLTNAKGQFGWQGGWDIWNPSSGNNDVIAVQNLLLLLKKYYAIDEKRIFCTGFSAGGNFCTTLAKCLPDVIAVMAPVCPAAFVASPPAGARYACLGIGGVTDGYGSADLVRTLNNAHKTNKTDADCYVFDMGHSYPPDDATVTPNVPFARIMTEYFLTHPRGYATEPPAPPIYARAFTDDFEGVPRRPDNSRWRVSPFDAQGILYGPFNESGNPGTKVFGYQFKIENGALNSQPIGTGKQGGLCMSGFMHKPSLWKTSFIVNSGDADLMVWPVVISDMSGRVVSLNVTKTGWQWQAALTHLAFRAQDAASIQSLSEGTFTLEPGTKYTASAELSLGGLTWSLAGETGDIAHGTLSNAQVALGESQFGMGLSGTNTSVEFNEAQLDGPDAVEPTAWGLYR